ncbi:MAG: sigma-70 family RNA polymerase sigma factor [Bryobacterales bacterium]|nr:sigma-70 family RNA polymerase sigma factor [Bryobacterales bacterium]
MRVRGPKDFGDEWPDSEGMGIADRRELNLLFAATYEELRRLARTMRRTAPNATLSPTTLVNEAWIKLAGAEGMTWESPLHFKRIAARAMRQLLIGAARRKNAAKRQNGAALVVTFTDELPVAAETGCGAEELLRLEAALEELARLSPRQASIVESRFFGGLEVGETAELLGVSEATVARDWRVAKAWLSRELRRDGVA